MKPKKEDGQFVHPLRLSKKVTERRPFSGMTEENEV